VLPTGSVTAALMTNAGVAVAPTPPPIVVPANPVPASPAPSTKAPEVPVQAVAVESAESGPGAVAQSAPASGEPAATPALPAEVAQRSSDAQPAHAAATSADAAPFDQTDGASPTVTGEAAAVQSAADATAQGSVAGTASETSSSPVLDAPVLDGTVPGSTSSGLEDLVAPMPPVAAIKPRGEWSVQVGLFRDAAVAKKRGEDARGLIPNHLKEADLVVSLAGDGVHLVSRFAQLSEQDAREACSNLQRGRVPCIVIPPGRPLVVANN